MTVDWNAVVLDLRRAGYTVARISRLVGAPRGTVDGWANRGKQPGWACGARLLRLWSDVTKQPLPEPPAVEEI